jgi:DNA-binding NtrC family response regulator/tetratricopeptide (TPR) repeat protein/class 3 adenylate cyclase
MDPLAELVGESAAIDAVRDQIRRLVARRTAGQRLPSILISGETGTGKGLVARTIHRVGPRSDGPYVDVNCAAIPETLLEAEFFGFERGAFTDARRAKPGLFQTAHRGTIFLDEVGLLPEALQAKLLKVLEEQAVRRLGATAAEPVDTWIISATNSDLLAAVRQRTFREDLYHRLAVLTLRLPPLRERGNDVLILAERFLARVCVDYTLPPRRLAQDAQARLLAYQWPGNIRELSNVIERVGLLAEQEIVTADMLGLDVGPVVVPAAAPTAHPAAAPASMDEAMRDHLLAGLEQTGWNISRTAAVLGLSRNTVRARIEKFGLRPGNIAAAPARADVVSNATPAAPPTAVPASPTHVGPSEGRVVSPPGLASIRWERRGVTLMRVSLVAPENIDELPDTIRTLELVLDKVQSFGGRVSELGGTGLDASFGLEPIEDAPRRAANAALAILKAVSRFREDETDTLPMRIALHSGHYMVGQVSGTRQLDQRAKRQTSDILETLVTTAEPDSTYISAATMPFLERHFELTPTGLHTSLAGRPYRLLGRGGTGLGLWGRMGMFVGRRHELDLLRDRWASVERGHGQVVGLVGEPGVGKSRLLWEFTQLRRDEDCVVLQAGAVALGNPMPYLPIIELLRDYFEIEGGGDPASARDKIVRTLTSLDPTLGSTLSALVALLDIQGEDEEWAGLDSRQRRQRILDAIRRLVLRQAREKPVLFLLEDAHWIDSETQAVLDSLVEGIPAARILLVLTYRPEYQHTWGSRTYYTQVRVDTLSPESADELLTSLLGEEASLLLLKPLLIEWTEGNPFFLEETVRTLVETEGLVGARGAYQLGKPVSSIQVPETVEEVLAARIDRLLEEDRRLLQSAAVIGRRVPYPVLIASLDVPEEALRERLRVLQAAEFLYEVSDFPHPEYTFKHALTQEVAYTSLPPERRRALHARILQAMETLYTDQMEEQIDRLAHHAFRGQVWHKALTYLERAGSKALARSANREAATYFEEALAALKHLPESRQTKEQAIDLRFELRNALTPLGQVKRTLEHLREANTLAEELADQRRLGRALAFATNCLYLMGDQKRAIESGQRAMAVAEQLDDFPMKVAASQYLGRSHYSSGNFLKAMEILEPLVASLTGERAREFLGLGVLPAVFSRTYLVMSLAAIGRFADGHRVGEEALDLARSTNHPDTMLWAFRGLGQFYLEQGEAERAVNLLESALALCRANDLPVYIPPVTSALGFAYALAGRVKEALPLLEHAAQEEVTRQQVINHAPVLLRLAGAYLVADRTEDAATAAARGLDVAKRWGDRAQEAHALRILGEISMRRGAADHGQATTLYSQALSLAERLAMRPLSARIHLDLGQLHLRAGESEKARESLTTAATHFRDMGMASWLFRTEAELSRLR